MQRQLTSDRFPLGSKLPSFKLRNVDGRNIGDDYLKSAKAGLVVFSCNHCPYVKGSESALIALARKYEVLGLRTVCINSNDASSYPEDSFEKMQEKAKVMDLPYPYLHDPAQEVARAFDAACTPECYLFDSQQTLVFHGTINDNPQDAARATTNFLEAALVQVFKGEKPEPAFVHPLGCSIKWK